MTGIVNPKVKRPALRWYGSKWRIAPWIIANLPRHQAYVEPYGGTASVLLRKPVAKIETVNDLDKRLVNFFTVLRDQSADLLRAIELTPYAKVEYEGSRDQHPDPLEDARRFYVLSWQGRTGSTGGRNLAGWRYERDPDNRTGGPVAREFAHAGHLRAIAIRLKGVQLEHDDALTVIGRYDTPQTLHYVDPPYVPSTRSDRVIYAHETDEAGHVALAEVLHAVQGMVVLSGYPSPLYDHLYAGWEQTQRETITDSAKVVAEVLWFNPAAAAALTRHRPSQGILL